MDDLAYVDGKAGAVKDETPDNAAGEARLDIKGSYGTKVCHLLVLGCSPWDRQRPEPFQ